MMTRKLSYNLNGFSWLIIIFKLVRLLTLHFRSFTNKKQSKSCVYVKVIYIYYIYCKYTNMIGSLAPNYSL